MKNLEILCTYLQKQFKLYGNIFKKFDMLGLVEMFCD